MTLNFISRAIHFPKTKRNNVALVTHDQNILSREGLLKVGWLEIHYDDIS